MSGAAQVLRLRGVPASPLPPLPLLIQSCSARGWTGVGAGDGTGSSS